MQRIMQEVLFQKDEGHGDGSRERGRDTSAAMAAAEGFGELVKGTSKVKESPMQEGVCLFVAGCHGVPRDWWIGPWVGPEGLVDRAAGAAGLGRCDGGQGLVGGTTRGWWIGPSGMVPCYSDWWEQGYEVTADWQTTKCKSKGHSRGSKY